jgi:hypothetical protein
MKNIIPMSTEKLMSTAVAAGDVKYIELSRSTALNM